MQRYCTTHTSLLTGALLYQGGWLAEFGGSVGFRLLKFLEDYVKEWVVDFLLTTEIRLGIFCRHINGLSLSTTPTRFMIYVTPLICPYI